MQKKYAIVRVDNSCPAYEDYIFCKRIDKKFRIVDTSIDCNKCKIRKNYGDTKEQLIRKVAQALVRARIEEDENSKSLSWEQIATRIVEFLGVEE